MHLSESDTCLRTMPETQPVETAHATHDPAANSNAAVNRNSGAANAVSVQKSRVIPSFCQSPNRVGSGPSGPPTSIGRVSLASGFRRFSASAIARRPASRIRRFRASSLASRSDRSVMRYLLGPTGGLVSHAARQCTPTGNRLCGNCRSGDCKVAYTRVCQ